MSLTKRLFIIGLIAWSFTFTWKTAETIGMVRGQAQAQQSAPLPAPTAARFPLSFPREDLAAGHPNLSNELLHRVDYYEAKRKLAAQQANKLSPSVE